MKNDVDKLSQFLVFLIIFIILLAVTGLTIPTFGKVLVDFLIWAMNGLADILKAFGIFKRH